MDVTLVKVVVKPDKIPDFIQATKLNHECSIQEAGNLRFDILHSSNDAGEFVLYEAYVNKEAALLHKQTDHYLLWRETVAGWMARPRNGVNYKGLFPAILDKSE